MIPTEDMDLTIGEGRDACKRKVKRLASQPCLSVEGEGETASRKLDPARDHAC
jgi:hypothetical protein